MTLLHEIVCNISGRDLDSAINYYSADINRLDCAGISPLEYAIMFGDLKATQTLLEKGADPNLSNGQCINRALQGEDSKVLRILELLFRFGATIRGSARHNAMNSWITRSYRSQDSTSLVVDKILIEHGCDVNHQCFGRALIMELCVHGTGQKVSADRIEQLIRYGANIELRDSQGYTALHFAIARQCISILKVLLRAGARLDIKTDDGITVIHLVVICGRSREFVKTMSEVDLTRLDLNLRNGDGDTAYGLLKKRNGLKWDNYFRPQRYIVHYLPKRCDSPEDEYKVILALETLLHQIQTSQGIPQDQQYPPLGDYLSDDKDEEPVPGAWPV